MGTTFKRQERTMRKWLLSHTACLALLLPGVGHHALTAETPKLRFAVVGDVHYKIPSYTVGDYFVEPVAGELATLRPRPSFLLQTGDFFHAENDTDLKAEAAYAFQHFSSTIGLPFLHRHWKS